MSPRFLVAALLLTASLSHAQDGGALETGSGLVLGAPLAVFPQALPLALDGQDRIILQPLDLSGNPNGPLECWNAAGSARINVLNTAPVNSSFQLLFAGLGQTQLVSATWGGGAGQQLSFTRLGCGVAAAPAGSYSFPGLYTPQNTGASLAPLLSNGDPVYATTGGLIRVGLATNPPSSSVLLTTAVLDAALGSFATDAGTVGIDERILSLAVDPADHLWAVVERRIFNSTAWDWIVELTPVGQVIVHRGPSLGLSPQTELVYDSALDAMLLRGQVLELHGQAGPETLGILPRTGPDGLAAHVPPWPLLFDPMFGIARALRLVVGGGTGGAKVVTEFNGYELRPLQLDATLADLDRDGLKHSEESALGTSDFLADSDGDGVDDGLEVHLYGTSPIDAGSAPPRPDAGLGRVLAESLFPGSWLSLDAGPECVHHAGYASGPALSIRIGNGLCGLPGGEYRWVNADGGALSTHTGTAVNPPVLTPDLGHAFLMGSDFAWTRLDLGSGDQQVVDAGTGVLLEHLLAFSKDTVIATEGFGRFGEEKLWRVGPSGAFPVIASQRAGCAILNSAADLASCATAPFAFTGIKSFDIRGWDPQRQLALVVVWTDHGPVLVGVGEDRVVTLSELLGLGDGLDPQFIGSLGAQGWEVQLGFTSQTTSFLATRALDSFFQPDDARFSPLDLTDPGRTGNFFRHGFLTTRFDSYLQERISVGDQCMASDGIFLCSEDNNPFMQTYVAHSFLAELTPVGPGIEKGEVIFYAPGTYGTELATWRDRTGGFGPFLGGAGFRLWRFTPTGATLPWLDAIDFTARLDAAAAAKVAQKPLTDITSIGASPDGLALCLVEPTNARVWELTLDPTTRALAGITLREVAEGVGGCGYDETGKLAVVTKSPVLLRVPGRADLAVTGAEQPSDLLRLPGQWVVASHSTRDSHCVADDGTVTAIKKVAALAPAFGGVAWLDEAGVGWLSPPAEFCAGTAVERLGKSTGTNIWMDFFGGFTFRSINSPRGAIAIRPDGVMVAGSAQLEVGGLGPNPQSVPRMLFVHFPTYAPINPNNRIAAVDPFRAAQPRTVQAARKPVEIYAMALIPGAPPGTDFGHLVREVPVRPFATDGGTGGGAGGGAGGAGGGGDAGAPKGCGCGAAPGGLMALLWAIVFHRQRRAR